uniref:DIOX_N domain-containing protein n=1 Tax=Strongyloides stercoralis TaxID=6248 RepID=A0A0K0E2K9_STRER
MPNIFQLTTPDLIAILRILKPDIFIDGKISNVNGNNENSFDTLVANNFSTYEDCKKLRSQITEWLLLNGYSTMHQFYKDPTTDTWIMPNDKSRLVECGKYRVSQKVPIIIPDLLFDETPYLFNPIDDSIDSGFNSARVFSNSINDNNNNNLIKTKSATDRVLMQSFAPLSARLPAEYYKKTLSPMECQINLNNSSSSNFKDPQLMSSVTISCQNNRTDKFINLPVENSSLTSLQNDMLPYCKNNNASFCSGIFKIFMCQQRI